MSPFLFAVRVMAIGGRHSRTRCFGHRGPGSSPACVISLGAVMGPGENRSAFPKPSFLVCKMEVKMHSSPAGVAQRLSVNL